MLCRLYYTLLLATTIGFQLKEMHKALHVGFWRERI